MYMMHAGVLLFLITVGCCLCCSEKHFRPSLWRNLPQNERSYVNDIAPDWDWRNANGENYCSPVRNQHAPHYCGSCYAMALTSSLSDRIQISNGNRWPQIQLSAQSLLDCVSTSTCFGGDPNECLSFMKTSGIVDESCKPYTAKGNQQCEPMCMECAPEIEGGCHGVSNYSRYYVSDFGVMYGDDMERRMMEEVYARGPIACEISCPESFESLHDFDIYEDKSNNTAYCHSVSVVGYGEEDGVKYWIVRNSWGSFWGKDGFCRVVRGKNNIMIESLCWWGDV